MQTANNWLRDLNRYLLVLLLSVWLAACGGGGGGEDPQGAPTITRGPAPVSVVDGSSATFSVAASGGGVLRYEWLKDGTPIAGANGPSYTTAANGLADDGVQFTVIVSNSGGSVTSNPAVLSVTPRAPVITQEPVAMLVEAGATASFNVQVDGSSPMTFQWRRDGTDIAGADSPNYTIAAVAPGDDGAAYTVLISNAGGRVSSVAAVLRVSGSRAATIVSAPASASINVGQSATFSVTAEGTAPLEYQWLRDGNSLPGATQSSYTISGATVADNGARFVVRVRNGLGTIESDPALLTVLPSLPTITQQPNSQSVFVGEPASFSVVAGGDGPFTYQWSRLGSPIVGATAATYTVQATTLANRGDTYTVSVGNAGGSVTSAVATLQVADRPEAPTISVSPQNQEVVAGTSATFAVAAAGVPAPGYQWQRNGIDIPGANAASYTTPSTVLGDSGAIYRVVVSNSAGAAVSGEATLTVRADGPSITRQPQDASVLIGRAATFSVAADGTAPLTFQWRRNNNDLAGETSPTYTLPRTVFADHNAVYNVVVRDAAGRSMLSNSVRLRVTPIPVESAHLASRGTLTRNADGSVWMVRRPPGVNSSTLTETPVLMRDSGGQIITGFTTIAAGRIHALAIDAAGGAWAFGEQGSARLGNGTANNGAVMYPIRVQRSEGGALSAVRQLAAGDTSSYALMQDGTVLAWGTGRLGTRSTSSTKLFPTAVVTADGQPLTNVAKIATGANSDHALALRADGSLWIWGTPGCFANLSTTLCLTGDNQLAFVDHAVPARKADGSAIVNPRAFMTSDAHTVVVQSDGTVLAWGSNADGQLGDGTFSFRNLATPMRQADGSLFDNVVDVSAGVAFTVLLRADGTVWSVGRNAAGNLGDGGSVDRNVPVQVIDASGQPLTGVVAISAASYGVIAKKSDGTFWEWGDNTGNVLVGLTNSNLSRVARRLVGFEP